jgi:glycosyltransferase involved in cell wall biosynthesis/MoaA/NifB/PqqE/SkfB family radical SAM enzyme
VTVCVVIPARNAAGVLGGCLDALARQSRPPDEVVVVDDCSTDETAAVALSFEGRLPLRLVREPEHGGAGRARHSGAALAKSDVLAFLDADCVPPADWLEKIEGRFRAEPGLGGVAGPYRHAPRETSSPFEWSSQFEEEWAAELFKAKPEAAFAVGGNTAYRRDVWSRRSRRELIFYKKVAASEDTLIQEELSALAPFRFAPDLAVVHRAAPAAKFISKHVLRGKSVVWGRLNGLRFSSARMLATRELREGSAVGAAMLLCAALAALLPWFPRTAAVLILAVFSAQFLLARDAFEGFARRHSLGPADALALRVLSGLRLALWGVGGLLAAAEWTADRLRFSWNLAASVAHFWRPGRISKLFFFVTSRCNARCDYCFNLENVEDAPARSKSELTLAEIETLAGKLGRLPYLTLSGGEPFLRADLPAVVEAFCRRARTQWATIPTNGSQTKETREAVLDILVSCPTLFLNVQISVDAAGEAHDRSRRLPDGFRRIEATMAELADLRRYYPRLRLQLATGVSEGSLAGLDDLAAFCRGRFQYDDHLYYLIRERGRRWTPHGPAVLAKYGELIGAGSGGGKSAAPRGWAGRAFRSLLHSAADEGMRLLRNPEAAPECRSTRKFVTLYDDGELAPCEVLADRFGNVRAHELDLPRMLGLASIRRFVDERIVAQKCSCDWGCAHAMNMLYDRAAFWRVVSGLAR